MSVDKSLGLLFPVTDEDERHFKRFHDEVIRLNLPFAVTFDHCCVATKKLFKSHPLFVGSWDDEDPSSFFDESYRQHALDILMRHGFDRYLHLDIDETLEKNAPAMLRQAAKVDADVIVFPCWELWNENVPDPSKVWRRVDGHLEGGQREKMFRIQGNSLRYPHPTAHAPNVIPEGKTREDAKVVRFPCHVLHWGIMNQVDAAFHKNRWDVIYTRKVGGNPYKGYLYYFDETVTPLYREVPCDIV